MNSTTNRTVSILLILAMLLQPLPAKSIHAEGNTSRKEVMFYASSRQEGAVTIQAQNFCGNGSVSTAGTVVCQGQAHLNGSMTEHAEGGRKILFQKLEQAYFFR